MQLTEKEVKLFKRWLRSHLAYGPVTVTFTKKDGSERIMKCTTNPSLIPVEPLTEDSVKREKKPNQEVLPVYDLDVQSWRSFRWDSIRQVSFTIGDE